MFFFVVVQGSNRAPEKAKSWNGFQSAEHMLCIYFCVSLPSSPSSKQVYSSLSKACSSPGSSLHRGEDGDDETGGTSDEGEGKGKA